MAADSVYGVGEIETALRRVGKGYVLSVNGSHLFHSWGDKPLMAGTAEEIAKNELGLDRNETRSPRRSSDRRTCGDESAACCGRCTAGTATSRW